MNRSSGRFQVLKPPKGKNRKTILETYCCLSSLWSVWLANRQISPCRRQLYPPLYSYESKNKPKLDAAWRLSFKLRGEVDILALLRFFLESVSDS